MTNFITSAGVQQFSITIASGATTGTATLGTAVGTGAYINYGGINPSVTANFAEAGAYLALTNSTTITATRQTGTTGTVVVTGSITDADTSNLVVAVQFGTVTITAGTSGTAAVTAPGSDANSAIHYLGNTGTGTVVAADIDFTTLTQSGTTVTATAAASGTTTTGFCLIEFQSGCLTANAVQRISATSSSSVTSFTASLSANVVLANSVSMWGGANIAVITTTLYNALMYGALSAVGTFTVHVGIGAADAKTYNASIIEFNSGVLNSAVQRGTTNLYAGTSVYTPITTVNETYSGVSWLGNDEVNTAGTNFNSAVGAINLTTETASSTVSVLNSVNYTGVASGTAKAITSATAGSLLAIAIALPSNSSNRTISSVTDNKGQTWTQFPGVAASTSGSYATDIWYFENTAAGVTSVTVTGSGAFNAGAYMTIYEVGGIKTSSSADAGAALNSGASSNPQVTGMITTAAACDFIIAADCMSALNQITGAGAPFIGGGANIIGAYYIPSTIVTNQTCSYLSVGASTYCASIASFLATSTATTTVDAINVTKNTSTGGIVGSWEVFEFPAFSGGGGSSRCFDFASFFGIGF